LTFLGANPAIPHLRLRLKTDPPTLAPRGAHARTRLCSRPDRGGSARRRRGEANVEDFADPPTLGTVERAFKTIAHGTYVLTPYGEDTHGHFTHYCAAVWKSYLMKFISGLPPPATAAR
jgi:hypothetical protein